MSAARIGANPPIPPEGNGPSSNTFQESFRRRFEELDQVRRQSPESMSSELMHDLLVDDLILGVNDAFRRGRKDAATDRMISVLEDMLERSNDKNYQGYDGSIIREALTRLNQDPKTILSSDVAERMLERLYNSHKNEESTSLMFWLSFFTREGFVDKIHLNQYYTDHYRELSQKQTNAKCYQFIEDNINRQPLSRMAEERLHVLRKAQVKVAPSREMLHVVKTKIHPLPALPSIQQFLAELESLRKEEKKAKARLDVAGESGSTSEQKEAQSAWNRANRACDAMRKKALQYDRALLATACREKYFGLDRRGQDSIQSQIAEMRTKGEMGAVYGPENLLEEMPVEFEAYYYAAGGDRESASIIAATEALEQAIMPGYRTD